jgi:uncharacterized membrane protein YagU involved in acid resistance
VTLRQAVAGVAAGLIGGVLGAGVMSVGHALVTRVAGDHFRPPSTESNEPDSTVLVAERLSEIARQRPLEEAEKTIAGHLVHYAFGATMGLVYGAVTPIVPIITAGTGALYGVVVYVGAHGTVVPALGLARSPLRSPLHKETLEFVLHVAYGVTVGLVHRLAFRTSRSARRR